MEPECFQGLFEGFVEVSNLFGMMYMAWRPGFLVPTSPDEERVSSIDVQVMMVAVPCRRFTSEEKYRSKTRPQDR